MKTSKSGNLAIVATGLAAALLFLATCAPGAQAPAAPAKTEAPAAPVAAATPTKPPEPKLTAEKPRRGGTWRVGGDQLASPPGLDAGRNDTASIKSFHNAVSCKLITWDERPERVPGAHEEVVPDLAERWENSADGTVWTFHLRKGVKLPPPVDKEITSKEVERALIRPHALLPRGHLNLQTPAMFTDRKTGKFDPKKPNLEIIDPYTLRITLSEPDADFLSSLGSHYSQLEFDQFYEPSDDGWGIVKKAEHIRGCGAFMLKEYVPGSHMTFVPNPSYYNKELPYLDVVEDRFMFEPAVGVAALRAGQLESWGVLIDMPLSLSKELESVPGLTVKYIPGGWYWPWVYDVVNPPFNDIRVRRALALALDRKSWIKDLYFGKGQNVVLVEPFMEFWNLPPEKMGEDGKYFTTYEPAGAKRLLTEAGYPKGFEFEVQTSNAAAHVVTYPMLELAKAYFEAIGVNMKINVLDYGAYLKANVPTGGVAQSGIIRPDLNSFVFSLIHPSAARVDRGPSGACLYCGLAERDPAYKKAVALMEQQKRTIDVRERLKLVHELQRLWAQNMWTFYYPVPDSTIINAKKVRGYDPIAGWNEGSWKYVWLAE